MVQRGSCEVVAAGWMEGAPGGSRTPGTRFRKPLLYPLSYRGTITSLSEILLQLAAAPGMAQAAQSLALDLTNALSRQAELLPHFL